MTGNQIAMLYHMSRGYNQSLNNHKVTQMQDGVVYYEVHNVLHKIYPTGVCYWFPIHDRDGTPLGRHDLSEYEGAAYND
jgi:hypothetical protein